MNIDVCTSENKRGDGYTTKKPEMMHLVLILTLKPIIHVAIIQESL